MQKGEVPKKQTGELATLSIYSHASIRVTSGGSTLWTGDRSNLLADPAQVLPGINPGVVAVAPVNADRVAAYRLHV
jgi:hypothetical protein